MLSIPSLGASNTIIAADWSNPAFNTEVDASFFQDPFPNPDISLLAGNIKFNKSGIFFVSVWMDSFSYVNTADADGTIRFQISSSSTVTQPLAISHTVFGHIPPGGVTVRVNGNTFLTQVEVDLENNEDTMNISCTQKVQNPPTIMAISTVININRIKL